MNSLYIDFSDNRGREDKSLVYLLFLLLLYQENIQVIKLFVVERKVLPLVCKNRAYPESLQNFR